MSKLLHTSKEWIDKEFMPHTLDEERFQIEWDEHAFLFYSNNPEIVRETALADQGAWLCREKVRGSGQVYTWHETGTEKPFISSLYLQNPHDFPLRIRMERCGQTNRPGWQSDLLGWRDYFMNYQPQEWILPAGQACELLKQKIPPGAGQVFGNIAYLRITDEKEQPATAFLSDIAYYHPAALKKVWFCAAPNESTTRRRGQGGKLLRRICLPPLILTEEGCRGYSFASDSSSFAGSDLLDILDSSGQAGGTLYGSYGLPLPLSLTVVNRGVDGSLTVFLGGNGGAVYPFVYWQGKVGMPTYGNGYYGQIGRTDTERIYGGFAYADVLDLGYLVTGQSVAVEFVTVLTAMGSAPFIMGVRRSKKAAWWEKISRALQKWRPD